MKTCTKCKRTLSFDNFNKHKGNPDGYTYHCKECRSVETRAYREKYPEKVRQDAARQRKINGPKYRAKRTRRYKENKKRAVKMLGGVCETCGLKINAYEVYDFHHKNPKEKKYGVGNLFNEKWGYQLDEELPKCILLCANCHRILHHGDDND